ncbi:MAG TPA: glycosyltransferase N-terminal domain-containing protein [Bacteroidia bacterium]|nr:glycosyltransferase N-terminal domain-containing protein [Bacteroidia bacterium]
MRNLYNLGIQFYGFAISIASLFNDKAGKWKVGRKDIFNKLSQAIGSSSQPLVWFHCASLGEFEQGRPVIESFCKKFPSYKILLTFFSPSGYEARKDYKEADYVFYLPLDTPGNAKRFIEIVKPKLAIFVKYEFWFNYLNELKNKNIPSYIVSAKFRDDQYFFKNSGAWFRKQLHLYKTLFVQDENSQSLLNKFGITNVIVCGDTRFDRVINISQQNYSDSIIENFKNGELLWICGSTWEEDEKIIVPVFEKLAHSGQKIKLLIVPHEVSETRIKSIQTRYPLAIRYSEANENAASSIMILDKMGLLSYIYRYADIAYVGGGFGKGIHNLTEAAVYGIPVAFGPNHQKFIEATELIKRTGGFSISSQEELDNCITKLVTDIAYRKASGQAGAVYILSGKGATDKIIAILKTTI